MDVMFWMLCFGCYVIVYVDDIVYLCYDRYLMDSDDEIIVFKSFVSIGFH